MTYNKIHDKETPTRVKIYDIWSDTYKNLEIVLKIKEKLESVQEENQAFQYEIEEFKNKIQERMASLEWSLNRLAAVCAKLAKNVMIYVFWGMIFGFILTWIIL